MEFGSVLNVMRKEAGLSQEKMAEKLHIARSSISKLENNQLELRAADLFTWTKETGNQELVAAMLLGLDVGVLQQALELVKTATVISTILGL
ncbi:MAG TPA: helix-turn-helix transcriptional regulator [Pseudogracilibacillus sp.]|nr:helix-turn-helix transcriptional regulator [Pseudogracilibacillus sp.]